MSKKKVYGVEFKEAYTRHEDLKHENVIQTISLIVFFGVIV